MDDYMFSGILIASSFTAGWMLYFFVSFLLKRRDGFFKGLKADLRRIKSPLRFLIPALCVSVIIPFLRLPEKVSGFISHFIQVLLIALFGWLIIKIVYIVRDALLNRYDINVQDNLHARSVSTQMRVITNIIVVLIVILMSFSGVRQIGVSILASAGVVGIVIGFAAQKTLGNLIAGIQIAVAQPIRLDDVVIVENE